MGYLDEDGFLYIAGRKKEMILCGGENIQPVEIENVLSAHPAVEEAAVVGVPDPLRGEHPRAYVRLREGYDVSALELKRFCHDYLAPFKAPRDIIFVSEFPRNTLGKILKWKLLDSPAQKQL
jgi:long-chain acyl-CoA synthetase